MSQTNANIRMDENLKKDFDEATKKMRSPMYPYVITQDSWHISVAGCVCQAVRHNNVLALINAQLFTNSSTEFGRYILK